MWNLQIQRPNCTTPSYMWDLWCLVSSGGPGTNSLRTLWDGCTQENTPARHQLLRCFLWTKRKAWQTVWIFLLCHSSPKSPQSFSIVIGTHTALHGRVVGNKIMETEMETLPLPHQPVVWCSWKEKLQILTGSKGCAGGRTILEGPLESWSEVNPTRGWGGACCVTLQFAKS